MITVLRSATSIDIISRYQARACTAHGLYGYQSKQFRIPRGCLPTFVKDRRRNCVSNFIKLLKQLN